MREYQRRRTEACPTGAHVHFSDDPDDPTKQIQETVGCDCPWLVIRESHPVPHVMVWPTAESVRRLVKEFDEGYFDLEGMPSRAGSLFLSPMLSKVMELVQAGDVVGAAMRLLANVLADQVVWSPETSSLSIRVPFDPGQGGRSVDSWLRLTFNPGEHIGVDRGPASKWPDEYQEELWHTDHAPPVAGYRFGNDVSGQIEGVLTDAGYLWQAAPAPVDGYETLTDGPREEAPLGSIFVPPQEGNFDPPPQAS